MAETLTIDVIVALGCFQNIDLASPGFYCVETRIADEKGIVSSIPISQTIAPYQQYSSKDPSRYFLSSMPPQISEILGMARSQVFEIKYADQGVPLCEIVTFRCKAKTYLQTSAVLSLSLRFCPKTPKRITDFKTIATGTYRIRPFTVPFAGAFTETFDDVNFASLSVAVLTKPHAHDPGQTMPLSVFGILARQSISPKHTVTRSALDQESRLESSIQRDYMTVEGDMLNVLSPAMSWETGYLVLRDILKMLGRTVDDIPYSPDALNDIAGVLEALLRTHLRRVMHKLMFQRTNVGRLRMALMRQSGLQDLRRAHEWHISDVDFKEAALLTREAAATVERLGFDCSSVSAFFTDYRRFRSMQPFPASINRRASAASVSPVLIVRETEPPVATRGVDPVLGTYIASHNRLVADLPKKVLFVHVHGYQGSSGDLRLVRDLLLSKHWGRAAGCHHLLCSSHSKTTANSIVENGERVAKEIAAFLTTTPVGTVHVFAHSMGTIIARHAFQTPVLTSVLANTHTKLGQFVSFNGPHLGTRQGEGGVMKTAVGLFSLTSPGLRELAIKDKARILEELASPGTNRLRSFAEVTLLGTIGDSFVPIQSAVGAGELGSSLFAGIRSLRQIAVCFESRTLKRKEGGLDTAIGRAEHIRALNDFGVIEQLLDIIGF
eukprot:gnl/Dysnectes_brevis/4466_a6016_549.p1 GENE.gnl/Dysnectes_brevis/4466_a6016_549~~gnl/Dysnectes_brevis/4466_a6016_549.p1  ORF type:complete len:674 (+),score=169.65 gnl/Dysnectes_brevis/4466_a6016_549:29-2023(+)